MYIILYIILYIIQYNIYCIYAIYDPIVINIVMRTKDR